MEILVELVLEILLWTVSGTVESKRVRRVREETRAALKLVESRLALRRLSFVGAGPGMLRGEIDGVRVEWFLRPPMRGSGAPFRSIARAMHRVGAPRDRGSKSQSRIADLRHAIDGRDEAPRLFLDTTGAEWRTLAACPARCSVRVSDHRVRIEHEGELTDSGEIEAMIRAAALLARLLNRSHEETMRSFREDAAAALLPEDRVRALRWLAGKHAAEAGIEDIARAAIADPNPQVRIAGARALGAEGASTLHAIVLDRGSPERDRSDALSALAEVVDAERLAPLLVDGLDSSAPSELRRRAVALVGERRLVQFLPELERLAERSGAQSSCEIAAALARLGSGAEPTLLRLLLDPAEAVCLAAIQSLSAVGTAASVESLHGVGDRSRASRAIHDAARDAVAAIQSRIEGAEAGQLSVADAADPHGALSPVDGRSGGLSETDPGSSASREVAS